VYGRPAESDGIYLIKYSFISPHDIPHFLLSAKWQMMLIMFIKSIITKISIIWNSQSSDIIPNMCRKAEVLPQYHIVSYHKCIDINIMKVYDDFSGSRYAGGKTVRRHIGAEREEIK
jgi:hypothetical protein